MPLNDLYTRQPDPIESLGDLSSNPISTEIGITQVSHYFNLFI